MANPSRFDLEHHELLSATGGWFFRSECLAAAKSNIMRVEVRLKEDQSPYLPGTKAVLVLGADAYDALLGRDRTNSLGEVRGSVFMHKGIPHIPSYLPQDTQDIKDYESEHNTLLANVDRSEPETTLKSIRADKRRHGVTSRANWRFFLKLDTKKAVAIAKNGGVVPPPDFLPEYRLYPGFDEILDVLHTKKDCDMYVDIETDSNYQVKCVGLSFNENPIYVIPLIDWNYNHAYPALHQLLRGLAISFRDNRVIAHNGSSFDWIVLAWKYGIPFPRRPYDTMLASHRCYPEIEKSLGHCTSIWTYEPFHKDEGTGAYQTAEQARQLWQYCGKDIYTMMLIHRAIDRYAATIPGLTASIQQANDSIRSYMLMTLMGLHYKQEKLNAIMHENDALMMQYLRCIDLLIGEEAVSRLRKKSKSGMPGSNAQCCEYFHEMLDYPVVQRSKKTGGSSLAKKAMYLLRLKHDNPVIDFILAYRELAKESGSLKFTPWRTHEQIHS